MIEHTLRIHPERWGRQKEPFALTNERSVTSPQAILSPLYSVFYCQTDLFWLEGLHRIPHARDAVAWHGADEPMPFVMSAKEFVLSVAISRHEKQMPHAFVNINNLIGGAAVKLDADIEIFALGVITNIDPCHPAKPVWSDRSDRNSGSHSTEAPLQ
jgi:hypothetical protein